ncbi:methyltransferase domain-containing protein [Azospirillum brasilense]|uniref:class I SAM-dependent methyltransferase n=1 Tax=Azospirillum brasilense TaxID=192 RepID=UPI000E69A3E2|nr:methyltransferase domain-containing protein [Azospirillum brasilense]NUB12639.1 methyltransferase domain-containing protein [Azospirillum brasilense]NUB26426.1 methyltransferase domain-containing protein [Azospirillum brasilense]NUB31897.1 methyltransferase domain-containing protein [Azospirillum brasilense]RIW03897.1 class I SAM-dependent methyltransferase [Azospirillum brasilense]
MSTPPSTSGSPHAAISPPSPWVVRFAPLVRSGGPVLDLACGSGRHLRLFQARNHPVVGLDRELRGVADLSGTAGVELVEADLESGAPVPLLRDRRFAAIVVTNYLHRPLFPAILDALEPGGLLLYETFALGNARFGRPASPAFLLRSGELLELARGRLQVVAYEHGEVASPKAAVMQRLCAVRDLEAGHGLDGDPEPRPLPA